MWKPRKIYGLNVGYNHTMMQILYINQLNIKKIFLLFVITTLSLFTFMSQTVSSQENSSSSFNIRGAPETGVDNLES